jgi:hypothetical protein
MKRIVIVIISLFFLVACSSEKKKQAPEVLLSEEQMVDVMTDIQIMEATISYKRNTNQKTAYLKTVGYDTIFSHYGITDSIFKENMKYYNDFDPQTLIRVMDSVEVRLGRMRNQ